MANREEAERYKGALNAFASGKVGWNKDTEDLLNFIAQTGRNCFDWAALKALLVARVTEVLGEGTGQEFLADREDVLKSLQSFQAAPFTLQRLCELLVDPHRHHKSKAKLLFALGKQTSVSSTLEPEPFPFEDTPGLAESTSAGDAMLPNGDSDSPADQMDISV